MDTTLVPTLHTSLHFQSDSLESTVHRIITVLVGLESDVRGEHES